MENQPTQSTTPIDREGFVHPEREQDQHIAVNPEGEKLAQHYNVNDQAHRNSSPADFTNTTSNFHHADGSTPPTEDELKTEKRP